MFTRARFFAFIRLGFIVTGLCLIYGFFIEPKTLAVRHITVKSKTWSGSPIKIALVSDIHIGGWHVDADRVQRLVGKINSQYPDIVLLAGDYVNGHKLSTQHREAFNAEVKLGIDNLGLLKAPLGIFAVMGNHDAWYSARLDKTLEAAGLVVLENQKHRFKNNETNICVVGFADFSTGKSRNDMFKACGNNDNIIAVMHSPDSFPLLSKGVSLALAGHTHGGQINLPMIGRRITATKIGFKYAYGLGEYKDIPTFVTSGVGTSLLPARFRAPPEIVIITLRAP